MAETTAISEKPLGPPSPANLKEIKGDYGRLKDQKIIPGPDPYETHQIGVFRTHISWGGTDSSFLNLKSYFNEILTGYLPPLYRLLSEIYELAPVLLVVYFVAMFWIGVSQAVEMTIASRTLRSVSGHRASSIP